MTDKINCWEFEKCGREPDGVNVTELGICQAAADQGMDGVNHGKNGGRICWSVVGTLCQGKDHRDLAKKKEACMNCAFFIMVKAAEKGGFQLFPGINYQSLLKPDT